MRRTTVVIAALVWWGTGCAAAPAARQRGVSPGADARLVAPPDTVTLSIAPPGRVMLAVGDTLQLRPELVEHYADAGFVR